MNGVIMSFILYFFICAMAITSLATHVSGSIEHQILNSRELITESKWRTLRRDTVLNVRKQTVSEFDVVGCGGDQRGAVTMFVWNSTSSTATLIREYNPSVKRCIFGVAAGSIDGDKHVSPMQAAAFELSEEAQLKGGRWIKLTTTSSSERSAKASVSASMLANSAEAVEVGVAQDKYIQQMFHAFLVIDPVVDENPRQLDDEEDIEIVRNVTIHSILQMIKTGELNIVGGWTALLAIEKLREIGLIER
jgi:hypothetical protein